MILINELIEKAEKEGYSGANATAKAAQDIVLIMLSKMENNKNVTVKGGVLMRSIAKDARRATQDLDIDLIRYSIEDPAIIKIINKLDGIEDIRVSINGKIEELKQQDYKGKRVHLILEDKNGVVLNTKIDFGVHTDLTIDQEEHCFDIGYDEEGVVLLANKKEQMFTEKLCSLLRHGARSTRYKDIYDMYFLMDFINKNELDNIMQKMIYNNKEIKENNKIEVSSRINEIFENSEFIRKADNPKSNWLDKDINEITKRITIFLKK